MTVETTSRSTDVIGSAAARRSGVRWLVTFMISLADLITDMDHANISATAAPMAREFGQAASRFPGASSPRPSASNFFLDGVLGPAWAVPMDVAGPASGTVTGVMNMTGAIGPSSSPLVSGAPVENGSRIYLFFVTAGVLIAGALTWLFLIDPEKSVVARPGDPAKA